MPRIPAFEDSSELHLLKTNFLAFPHYRQGKTNKLKKRLNHAQDLILKVYNSVWEHLDLWG